MNSIMKTDILFKTDDYIFSYRVAGICIHNEKVLFHKAKGDAGYAFPGGHVSFGETNAETLIREFMEEIGAEITVGELKWVGEIFFPLKGKPCHQICLYYSVEIKNIDDFSDDVFTGTEEMSGGDFQIEFHWIPLVQLNNIKIYPEKAAELMMKLDSGIQHFIDKEI